MSVERQVVRRKRAFELLSWISKYFQVYSSLMFTFSWCFEQKILRDYNKETLFTESFLLSYTLSPFSNKEKNKGKRGRFPSLILKWGGGHRTWDWSSCLHLQTHFKGQNNSLNISSTSLYRNSRTDSVGNLPNTLRLMGDSCGFSHWA